MRLLRNLGFALVTVGVLVSTCLCWFLPASAMYMGVAAAGLGSIALLGAETYDRRRFWQRYRERHGAPGPNATVGLIAWSLLMVAVIALALLRMTDLL